MFGAKNDRVGKTWVQIGGESYGAMPDEQGPIGGGKGYRRIHPAAPEGVRTLDGLLDSLQRARHGEVVWIAGDAEIDCTERVYIEKLVLEIAEGVTLASDRGEGRSKGGLIFSDALETRPLVRAMGPDVRITGLRIRGPNPKPCLEHHRRSFGEGGGGHEYYYKFPVSDGIVADHPGLEVDNCELGGWSCSAVGLRGGDRHYVHHNFIHHNQYNGLGYGVSHGQAFSLIEYNLFNLNRHSIAGSGNPGSGYEARHNVEIRHSLSHCFDMHGGRDRKDGTDIAGTYVKIHHNTFRPPRAAVVIRGLPEREAEIHHNWFHQAPEEISVRSPGRTFVHDNAYGLRKPVILARAEPRP